MPRRIGCDACSLEDAGGRGRGSGVTIHVPRTESSYVCQRTRLSKCFSYSMKASPEVIQTLEIISRCRDSSSPRRERERERESVREEGGGGSERCKLNMNHEVRHEHEFPQHLSARRSNTFNNGNEKMKREYV
ncbi:unnamed protein product [Danaus chrysippus]|uniref:(African queen) hypothetical protein n=1 Tax=Danaus chrysippus TaxID=151541 RepID=A0A8J2QN52_9NEOP|nr:unnamed protein product [Danaus chrysippus]